jgi:hypothetical protein
MDDGIVTFRHSSLIIRPKWKISPKTGMVDLNAVLHYLRPIRFARIQEGDVARMAKLVVLAGATTRAR